MEAQILDPANTYTDIAERMKARGWEISRSTIFRKAHRMNAVAVRLEESRRQTMALIQYSRENNDVAAGEIATSILMDSLTRRISTADDEIGEIPIEKAGKLLIDLQRSTVYRERMKGAREKACQAIEANILRKIRAELAEKPELLEQLTAIVQDAVREEAARDDDK